MTDALEKRQALLALPSMTELGTLLAKSGYFQDAREMAQAVVKVLAGQELGFGPIASMTGVNIIKGKVALSANLIAASIKRSGRYNYRVLSLTDKECSIRFFEGTEAIGESKFTIEDAKKAGLAGANWVNFPRNMLFARAISNGAKWYCPDLSGGPVYTPDELGVATNEDGEITDTTPSPAAPTPTEKGSQVIEPPTLDEPAAGDTTNFSIMDELWAMVTELQQSLGWTNTQLRDHCASEYKVQKRAEMNQAQVESLVEYMRKVAERKK